MRLKLLVLPVLFLLTSLQIRATHIVGGEMNYKYLGGNNYEIRLTVYRDCYVGVPPFDNPAVMGIFDVNNNFIDSVWLPFLGLDTLPPTINDPCFIPPTDFCYEVTTYIDTINLPPITGGYIISYQRCCRNQNILNITFPECAGATYWAHIPGPEVVAINSNPVFKNWPPPFVCANKPWVFDHSANDYDGDSLVYELYTPYTGLDAACPVVTTTAISPSITGCSGAVTTCPNFPVNPPFFNVNWFTPTYGLFNVFGGVPLAINSATGLVTATPNTLGYFVYGVKCKEYRNGVLISETLRDFQLIVKDCPAVVVAAATVPSVYCGSSTVSFSNSSIGASSYSWYFGDPTTTADSSNLYSPSYTYPTGAGSYNVIMVAYAPNNPACNDSVTTSLSISDNFAGTFTFQTQLCDNYKYLFTGSTVAPPGTTVLYEWNFGDGTGTLTGSGGTVIPTTPLSPSSNNNGNSTGYYESPVHVYPTGNGTYPTTLIISIPGSSTCKDTVSIQTVTIGAEGALFIPNIFTPNNDGKNDIFRVKGPQYTEFYLAVYNRWGQLLFESTDQSIGWDGTFNSMKSDPGVFGWYLKASCGPDKEQIFKKGNVTLIR
ncbi:MAG: gliding motility-associated C-terminal domain-containing protein [Bacteroidia bacterium]|nr:gliding motility-associated C-terminal domain-containing protein [Bacteroidia bacterium]